MATFREFMQGLAKNAPQMSQTIYDYYMFKAQMVYKEREFAMEEKKTEAYADYYETAKMSTEMEMEERERMLPLKIANEELAQEINRLAFIAQKNEVDRIPETNIYNDKIRELNLKDIEAGIDLKTQEKLESSDRMGRAKDEALFKKRLTELQLITSFIDGSKNPEAMGKIAETWENTPGTFVDKSLAIINSGDYVSQATRDMLQTYVKLNTEVTALGADEFENRLGITAQVLLNKEDKNHKTMWKTYFPKTPYDPKLVPSWVQEQKDSFYNQDEFLLLRYAQRYIQDQLIGIQPTGTQPRGYVPESSDDLSDLMPKPGVRQKNVDKKTPDELYGSSKSKRLNPIGGIPDVRDMVEGYKPESPYTIKRLNAE